MGRMVCVMVAKVELARVPMATAVFLGITLMRETNAKEFHRPVRSEKISSTFIDELNQRLTLYALSRTSALASRSMLLWHAL